MKIKVAVLFGGKSTEHEISVISAIQAIGSLNKEKYDVIPVYITKDNLMYVGDDIGKIESYTNIKKLLEHSQRVIFVRDEGKVKILKYPFKAFSKGLVDTVDIFFPIVHGTNAEDGTLQGYLKMFGIPYVGCDVLSSAVGMDKYVMKAVLKDNGIPVLDCKVFTSKQYDEDADSVVLQIEEASEYPVIVKPIDLGSSIGISKAGNRDELFDSLENAFQFANKVLVEKAVRNLKEINCSVLGDYTEAKASECEEPVSFGGILSFDEKYLNNGSKKTSGASKGMASLSRKIPADITPEQKKTIQDYAVKAFKVLGCSGVSRIDFMMDSQTGEIWLNEINTIPGSLSFYLWEPVGTSYSALLDEMISLALKRDREENNLTYTFNSNVLEGVKLSGTKGAKGSKFNG
ncbi:MAG: D-alanine--D-alanine ligase [Oscillospiraceae bacterium]|nr:D-alanine--D-alanine ligase [Oscillospiraceae bacterium]